MIIVAIVVGLLVGMGVPLTLGAMNRRHVAKSAVSGFLVIDLTCSECGHEGAIMKVEK